jgi:glucosyl-dolichyl phosphate glucuronosyltransferase
MDISLIVCTYNRCESLPRALESIALSEIPDSIEWEVLVVDNNSRDRTREAVEAFVARFPGRFRYLFEPRQGLSNARNAGIAAAQGRALAFTDDDVTVDSNWLWNLTQPLLEGSCAGTAGRILLGDFQPPPWLAVSGSMSLGGTLAQFDLGDRSVSLDKAPFGACMAFQKSVFEEFGDFRTDLGRAGKNLIGNEDTEFGARLLSKGTTLLYVPSAIVHHPVLRERLTKRYFRSFWFAYGRAMVRQNGERQSFWMVPRTYIRQLRRRYKWMKGEDQFWYQKAHGRFFCEVHVIMTFGQIVEGWERSFRSGLDQ